MKNISLLLLFCLTILSCANKNNTESTDKTNFEDHHTAENSLDWAGTYYGELPCANCDRIETELTLKADLQFELIENHIKNDSIHTTKTQGKFVWEGNNIKLSNITNESRPAQFKVVENAVIQLDLKGNEIEGEMSQMYRLNKTGNEVVEGNKWEIIELNGKKINGTPETHFISFDRNERRLNAKIGCNSLINSYKITNQLQIKIESGIATKMYCENMEEEIALIKALETCDNLSVNETTLTLNKGRMAPLVVLKLIE
jgi:heat shock protein HslJ